MEIRSTVTIVILFSIFSCLLQQVTAVKNDEGCCTSSKTLGTECCQCFSNCTYYNNGCINECPKNHYQANDSFSCDSGSFEGPNCKLCDENCDPQAGCNGSTSSDCFRCRNYSLTNPNTMQKDCVDRCPAEYYGLNKTCESCQVLNCSLCEPFQTSSGQSEMKKDEEDYKKCRKKCEGFNTNSPAYSRESTVYVCQTCKEPSYLVRFDEEEDISMCTCCVEECPEGYQKKEPYVGKKQCVKQKPWCIFPNCTIVVVIIAVVVVCLFIMIIFCCWCRNRKEKPSSSSKPPPTAYELNNTPRTPPVSGPQQEPSAAAAPPLPPPLRPDSATGQDEYYNVEPKPNVIDPKPSVQQEVYENQNFINNNSKHASRPPTLPPPRNESEDDDRPDYENEAEIEKMAKKRKDGDKPVAAPAPHGHKNPKGKGYVNQSTIDAHERQKEEDATEVPYENTSFQYKNNRKDPPGDGVQGRKPSNEMLKAAVPPPAESNSHQAPSRPYYNIAGNNNYYNDSGKTGRR